MLVLTQKRGNEVVIVVPPSAEPTTLTVKLVEVERGKVRLGFEAPREVSIHRREILDRMAAAQQMPIEGE